MAEILEIKRHLNKPDEHYLCTLLQSGEDHMVLKYVNEKPARLGDAVFKPGQPRMLTIKRVPALYRGK